MLKRIMKWGGGLLLLVLIAGMIAPYFVRSRGGTSQGQCIGHLKQIDGAIQQWALENKKLDSDAVDLTGGTKYLKGGYYQAGSTVKDKPTYIKAEEFGLMWPA